MEIIRSFSTKGKEIIIIDGYTYRKVKLLKNGEWYWICTVKNCKAKIYTSGHEDAISRSDMTHTHEKNIKSIRRKLLNNSVKRKAIENLSKRAANVITEALEENMEILENMSENEVLLLRRNMYNYRKRVADAEKEISGVPQCTLTTEKKISGVPQCALTTEKEKLIYVTCVACNWKLTDKPDYLATVDVDPSSPTYSKIIHKLKVPYVGDELHHTGWNACGSCEDVEKRHKYFIMPGLNSDRIYIVDTHTNPFAPQIFKVIEPETVHKKANAGAPHTVHCLPSGDVMISCLGDPEGNPKGSFMLLEQGTFDVKGTWQDETDSLQYNYDYWYQPRHNVMVSTEWAAPKSFRHGFSVQDLSKGLYGKSITFWDWSNRKPIKTTDLGPNGLIPLEVRFLHNPDAAVGFVGCALSSSVFRFYKNENDSWETEQVIQVKAKKVKNWFLPNMPGLITDILISMDDRFLYISNWIHGDIRQYNISNPKRPVLVGQVFLGGSICSDSKVIVTEDKELEDQPERPFVKGTPILGGPQMLQLSLDGERLYVTNSLSSAWDIQFYPENILRGSLMLKINVDTEKGGLELDKNFLVDFGASDDIALAHEMRFPGGDSTSDIKV